MDQVTNAKTQIRLEQWRKIIADCQSSGMPVYKFVSNRFLTEFENFVIGEKLSEYHTGFRGFTKNILETCTDLLGIKCPDRM